MRRVLLDEGVPIGVRWLVAGFPVDSAAELGWAGLANGDLIEAAEQAGYDVAVAARNRRWRTMVAAGRPRADRDGNPFIGAA